MLGRRGHLSQNSLEDVDPNKRYYIFLKCLLGLRLPSHFARGVHVFQASSRRLPGKHDGFDNVNNVVWKTVADIAVEYRQRIGGAHMYTAAFTCWVWQRDEL